MQELEFVTELKAPRLDLQGLWMLLPDPELFEDVDFETVSADVIVSWSLVPELDSRAGSLSGLRKEIENVNGVIQWRVFVADLTEDQLSLFLNTKNVRDLGETLVGTSRFDLRDFDIDTSRWFFDPKTGALEINKCSIYFHEEHVTIN